MALVGRSITTLKAEKNVVQVEWARLLCQDQTTTYILAWVEGNVPLEYTTRVIQGVPSLIFGHTVQWENSPLKDSEICKITLL